MPRRFARPIGLALLCVGVAFGGPHLSRAEDRVEAQSTLPVFHDPEQFAAWPANGGLWSWDDGREALVGFVVGRKVARDGHDVAPPFLNVYARTRDGGTTWSTERTPGVFQTGDAPRAVVEAVDFRHPDLALKFIGDGQHGGGPPSGLWNISTDRGRTWRGASPLPRLIPPDRSRGRDELTLRTDYLVLSRDECLLFGSARSVTGNRSEQVFAAKLVEQGCAAEFLGWFDDPQANVRGLMPSSVAIPRSDSGPLELLSAVRSSTPGQESHRIDGYRSTDAGRSWTLSGTWADTGDRGGNPPALVRLRDGRLVLLYGHRARRALLGRVSRDQGRTWSTETALRDAAQPDATGDVDPGYPRAFQSPDGAIVVLYHWRDTQRPASHIAATVWRP